jgi:hypothetical protein
MGRRLLIVVVALFVATGFGLLLRRTRAGDTPEVRLLQGPDKVAGFYALREPRPPVSWGLTGLEPKPWTARFQIRVPPGSDIILSNGAISVEMRDANGNCVATGTLPTFPSSPLLPMPSIAEIHMVSVTPTLPVAPPTRNVRFSIGYRTATLQVRGRKEFNKCGFRHRLPRLADWTRDGYQAPHTGWCTIRKCRCLRSQMTMKRLKLMHTKRRQQMCVEKLSFSDTGLAAGVDSQRRSVINALD